MLKNSAVLLMITAILVFTNSKVTADHECNYGDVRLVNGSVPSEGRVEVCVTSNGSGGKVNDWGTVCEEYWEKENAEVVCKQLNYSPHGAKAVRGAFFGQGRKPLGLSKVHCTTNEVRLLECDRSCYQQCNGGRAAGVRCSHHLDDNHRLQVENVSATIIGTSCSTKHHSVLVSWQLRNSTMNRPTSFSVKCRNDRLKHSAELSVNNETFLVEMGGLFPTATYYNCCVKAVNGSVADEACTLLQLPASGESDQSACDASDNWTVIVGGVLGFIIAVLLILLIICGGALINKRSVGAGNSMPCESTEMPVTRNLSYGRRLYQSTTCEVAGGINQSVNGRAAVDHAYSSIIDPSYMYENTVNSRQQRSLEAVRNQVIARLSERHNMIREAHFPVASTSRCGGNGIRKEPAAEYEVPLDLSQSGRHEQYSRHQH